MFIVASAVVFAVLQMFLSEACSSVTGNQSALDSTNWEVTDLCGERISGLTDNSLQTMATLLSSGASAPGLFINLGSTVVLHRIHIIGQRTRLSYWPNNSTTRKQPPIGLIVVSVGDTPDEVKKVADFLLPFDGGNPIDVEVEMRFRPVAGRFIKLEMKPANAYSTKGWWEGNWLNVAVPPVADWNIGEIEIGGFPAVKFEDKGDAVVLPDKAAKALNLAADELSYYLGELLGRPIPVITPDQTAEYSGTLYTLVDLKPLAPDYETMMANAAEGLLPERINIEINGREVLFKAWPYRNVLKSVWEFLHRQGVRFIYPDGHGDNIPSLPRVDLSFLPLRTVHCARRIYANWDTAGFLPWPQFVDQTLRQEYLNIWRNGWTGSWDTASFLFSSEVPLEKENGTVLDGQYTEKFAGYPHNFSSVIPDRILQTHREWCGFSSTTGARICPPDADSPAFDMSNPTLIQWVADKIVAVENSSPIESTFFLRLNQTIGNIARLYNLLPMDSARFDQSDRTVALNTPLQKRNVSAGLYEYSQSGAYYYFINEVAKLVRAKKPDIVVGALAYSDVWDPPQSIEMFSDNVQVEVCMYGASNLPTAAKVNEEVRQGFLDWRKKIKTMETYDYALLHTEYWQQEPQLPVAMVSGLVDRAKFLAGIDALNGGTQASPESYPFNPWSFYVYPRIRQDIDQTAEQLLNDIFEGYFRESALPMRNYYKTMEDYQVKNDIDMRFLGNCFCYGIAPGSFPNILLAKMEAYLRQAEEKALSWVVKSRLAKIREGFDWIIAKRQLQGVALDSSADYPVVGRKALALDLTKGIKPDHRPGGNYAERIILKEAPCWVFWAHGTLYQSLNFVEAGKYRVKLEAAGIAAKDVWPIMNVYIGPKQIGSTEVVSKKGEYNEYIFDFDIQAGFGVQDFLVSCRNAAEGGARNLFIKSVMFEPVAE